MCGASMAQLSSPFRARPMSGWERWALLAVLTLFVLTGINHIRHDAFIGQDFSFHEGCTNLMLGRPTAWFSQDVTNRPLIYWIAIDGILLTGNRAPFEFAAGVFLLLNTGALWLMHDSSRRFISTPALRIAAVALIGLWPATTVTTVVFAADAMSTPPFALLGWSLIRWAEANNFRAAIAFAALAGCALSLGNFAKFTFILLPAGVVFAAALAARWKLAPGRSVVVLLALGALVPATVGITLHHLATRALEGRPQHHRFNWSGTGEMSWRSLLGLKASDVRIFDAPGYWDSTSIEGRKVLPLLENNSYSYLALLHLGTFTDVLDFSHGGSKRSGRPRPEPQKSFSKASVRGGVIFSVGMLTAVALLALRLLKSIVRPERPPSFALIVWLLLGATWFVPLVLTLPFVHHAYDWGYWLPRLVLPGSWAAGLALFGVVDEFCGQRRALTAGVAILTLAQAWLQIRTVWY
jgi:hypothetical protein